MIAHNALRLGMDEATLALERLQQLQQGGSVPKDKLDGFKSWFVQCSS